MKAKQGNRISELQRYVEKIQVVGFWVAISCHLGPAWITLG